jgi:VIT1/CCC1 family predicted Fe2+/Mn2+ transporter
MSQHKINIDVDRAIRLHKEGKAGEIHGIVDSKILKAMVYGANDGIVTTFAVVAGVAGAGLAPHIVLILGVANMFADGLSMGIGDFLGERSEQRYKDYQFEIEKWEVKHIPEEEKKELVQYFQERGVSHEDTQKLADTVSKYPNLWAEIGFIEEMGELPVEKSELWFTGVATFLAFVAAGALPLIPYTLQVIGVNISTADQFAASIIATGIALFFIGSLRTILTKGKWWWNGLEMLFIGAIAAVCAYAAGAIIQHILP